MVGCLDVLGFFHGEDNHKEFLLDVQPSLRILISLMDCDGNSLDVVWLTDFVMSRDEPADGKSFGRIPRSHIVSYDRKNPSTSLLK